jgi:hypothetical protein
MEKTSEKRTRNRYISVAPRYEGDTPLKMLAVTDRIFDPQALVYKALGARDFSGEKYNLKAEYFIHCHLAGSTFEGAQLTDTTFDTCTLRYANFEGCDLRRATFIDCALQGANFNRAKINWSCHALVAQIIENAAHERFRDFGDGPDADRRALFIERLQVSGAIRTATGYCWSNFMRVEHPQKEWALGVLAAFVQPEHIYDIPSTELYILARTIRGLVDSNG